MSSRTLKYYFEKHDICYQDDIAKLILNISYRDPAFTPANTKKEHTKRKNFIKKIFNPLKVNCVMRLNKTHYLSSSEFLGQAERFNNGKMEKSTGPKMS